MMNESNRNITTTHHTMLVYGARLEAKVSPSLQATNVLQLGE